MSVELGAIVTAMVTPFDDNGQLDLSEAQRLARWLVARGKRRARRGRIGPARDRRSTPASASRSGGRSRTASGATRW